MLWVLPHCVSKLKAVSPHSHEHYSATSPLFYTSRGILCCPSMPGHWYHGAHCSHSTFAIATLVPCSPPAPLSRHGPRPLLSLSRSTTISHISGKETQIDWPTGLGGHRQIKWMSGDRTGPQVYEGDKDILYVEAGRGHILIEKATTTLLYQWGPTRHKTWTRPCNRYSKPFQKFAVTCLCNPPFSFNWYSLVCIW